MQNISSGSDQECMRSCAAWTCLLGFAAGSMGQTGTCVGLFGVSWMLSCCGLLYEHSEPRQGAGVMFPPMVQHRMAHGGDPCCGTQPLQRLRASGLTRQP